MYVLIFGSMKAQMRLNWPAQVAVLLGVAGVCMILGAFGMQALARVMGVTIEGGSIGGTGKQLGILNSAGSFLIMCLPALIFASVVSNKPMQHLGFNGLMGSRQILLVLFISAAAVALSGALAEVMELIQLPASIKKIADAMEESYKREILKIATIQNLGDYLFALLVIALLPALFEEILFRGAVQQTAVGLTRNAFVGILITSVLFSAIHFSVMGFLSRTALGLVLGYVFYYSKNLWLSILMHFINNAFVITALYIAQQRGRKIEDAMEESMPIWFGVIALAAIVWLMMSFRKASDEVHAAHQHDTQETLLG
jgi:membrane protease YdiL (CAAX protease family)